MRHLWNLLSTPKVPSSRLCAFLSFDDKAGVWFVSKSDVPGLNAESESQEELVAIVQDLVPELLNLNAGRCFFVVARDISGVESLRRNAY